MPLQNKIAPPLRLPTSLHYLLQGTTKPLVNVINIRNERAPKSTHGIEGTKELNSGFRLVKLHSLGQPNLSLQTKAMTTKKLMTS